MCECDDDCSCNDEDTCECDEHDGGTSTYLKLNKMKMEMTYIMK